METLEILAIKSAAVLIVMSSSINQMEKMEKIKIIQAIKSYQ